jgi:hypothetical protein
LNASIGVANSLVFSPTPNDEGLKSIAKDDTGEPITNLAEAPCPAEIVTPQAPVANTAPVPSALAYADAVNVYEPTGSDGLFHDESPLPCLGRKIEPDFAITEGPLNTHSTRLFGLEASAELLVGQLKAATMLADTPLTAPLDSKLCVLRPPQPAIDSDATSKTAAISGRHILNGGRSPESLLIKQIHRDFM